MPSPITPAQIRAARALLGWRQVDLSERSGVSEIAVKNIERGASKNPRDRTLAKLREALEMGGVRFQKDGVSAS